MTTASAKKTGTRRALPKEVRKEQLIRATMKSIAEHGLSGTTMATVTRQAGLSMGIANLHFESKDRLLSETLQYVANEYANGQAEILDSAEYASVADKLQALVAFDFSAKVTQKNKLAVWMAFWGEAKSRPTYQRIRADADIQSEQAISALFAQAIAEGGYAESDPDLLATGYTALIDGLWLDLLVAPRQVNREKAKKIVTRYLASAFPRHIAVS